MTRFARRKLLDGERGFSVAVRPIHADRGDGTAACSNLVELDPANDTDRDPGLASIAPVCRKPACYSRWRRRYG